MTVSNLFSNLSENSVMPESFATSSTSAKVAFNLPYFILFAIVSLNKIVSCVTIEILFLNSFKCIFLISFEPIVMSPL